MKNKYDAYQRFKDFYNREVITISGEDDYEKFEILSKNILFLLPSPKIWDVVSVSIRRIAEEKTSVRFLKNFCVREW